MTKIVQEIIMKPNKQSIKKLFLKKGTCSKTYFYLLNREFGSKKEAEENASDYLAGGIYQQGYQCGMLWGATLAVGTESFRRCETQEQAIGLAVRATKYVLESFSDNSKSVDCEDITDCDFTSKLSMAKYFFSGRVFSCFNLAEDWAPEAIKSAKEGLLQEENNIPQKCLSCASEVAKKMGATEEESTMVAGFAGGIGLSGNACGALATTIWMKALEETRENPKASFFNSQIPELIEKFYEASDYKILCSEITGENFESVEDHTKYIKNGGCCKLIDTLARL